VAANVPGMTSPAPETHPALERLLGALDLDAAGSGVWEARHPVPGLVHLFGGQVLAQGLMAAYRECPDGTCHSLHAYFLKRGTTEEPIRFEVAPLRHSRSFRTLEVTARQSVGPILQMTLSFHDAEPGPAHQVPMDEVGPPAGQAYERALLDVVAPGGIVPDAKDHEFAVEIRSVGNLGLFSTDVERPNARVWMRMRGALPDDPILHQCLFTYASDYPIMIPTLNPHPRMVTEFQTASLDHALWFHRPFRMDQWLLFELDSPVAASGLGLGRGLLYTRDGTLVASCVQESLLRPRG
jgi:acyl-CoA thioesterase II